MGEQRTDQYLVSVHSKDRRKLLTHELARCIRLLTEHGAPEKVILFGTLAKGRIHEWSEFFRKKGKGAMDGL